MANKQLLLPGEIVKKHNTMIRCKVSISGKNTSRLLACLIACIKTTDAQFKDVYKISAKDFLVDDGGGKLYAQAKEACRELGKAAYERDWGGDPYDPSQPFFEFIPFFSSIRYYDGIIEAKFNPEMQGCLIALRQFFTQYDLMEYLNLPSLYSQRIFEILKSYASQTEVVLALDELHNMLNTPASLQGDFKDFRRRVLEKAHKDIHKYTNFEYEWEPIKKGRGIAAVRFFFTKGRMIEHQKEKKQADNKKLVEANNKLFLSVRDCRKKHDLSGNGKCQNPTCSAKKKELCESW